MKYAAAVMILLFVVLASSAAAQERRFDITISIEDSSSAVGSDEAVLRVRLLNRGKENLRTDGLGELNIYLSKCQPGDPSCDGSAFYYARVRMPSTQVLQDRSTEFLVGFSGLSWQPGPFNPQNSGPAVNLAGVPRENIYFFSDVKIIDGFSPDPSSGKREPRYRQYLSNVLTFVR